METFVASTNVPGIGEAKAPKVRLRAAQIRILTCIVLESCYGELTAVCDKAFPEKGGRWNLLEENGGGMNVQPNRYIRVRWAFERSPGRSPVTKARVIKMQTPVHSRFGCKSAGLT